MISMALFKTWRTSCMSAVTRARLMRHSLSFQNHFSSGPVEESCGNAAISPISFDGRDARVFLDHLRSVFKLPRIKDEWKKNKGMIKATFSWDVSRLKTGKPHAVGVSNLIEASVEAPIILMARDAGYANLARLVADRMSPRALEYHYTEALAKVKGVSTAILKSPVDGNASAADITHSIDFDADDTVVSPADQPRTPMWLQRAVTGDFSPSNVGNCIDYIISKYKTELKETSKEKKIQLSKNHTKKSVSIELRLPLPPEFPFKSTAKRCAQLSGVGKGDSSSTARSAARLRLAKEIYRVFGFSAPIVNVDCVLHPTVQNLLKNTVRFLQENSSEVFGGDVSAAPERVLGPVLKRLPDPVRNKYKMLPIWEHRDEIMLAIDRNQVTIISSLCGSGKTTQIPQFLFDFFAAARPKSLPVVVVAEPYSLTAMCAARRVSKELRSAYPDSVADEAVGYEVQTKNTPVPCQAGSIEYVSTDVLLKRMQKDPALSTISHIILDEVNDGAVKSDMLLSLCRNLMQQRPNLKLILFSSKPNVGNLVGYFERRQLSVGTVNNKISTTYPVSEIYLKDIINDTLQGEELDEHSKAYCKAELSAPSGGARHEMVIEDHTLSEVPFNLVRKLILRICSSNPQGNILVFLPGITEIERLYTMLENDDVKMTKIFALHEKKDRDIMKYAFSSVKKGYRKIVLATDAVEMNLTIPGVAHVIDTGRQQIMLYSGAHRMTRRDMCRLPSDRLKYRVARAAAVEGGCYYGIYNKEMHHNITSQQTNEILHTDVDQVCLTLRAASIDSNKSTPILLSELPVRLDTKIENEAMSRLINIGAFVQDQDSVGPSEQLTALGRALALLPVHPTMGKMLILGSLFGCLGPILTIVSAAGEKLLRPMSTEAERAVFVEYLAKLPASESNSDHLLTQHLYQIAVDKRIHPPFLSYRGVKQIASARDQIEGHLLKLFRGKFPIDLNQNSDNHALQRLVLTAGLLPAVVVAMPDKGFYLCHVLAKNVPMAYASACHHVWNSEAKKSPEFFVYSDLVEQDRKRFVSNVTAIDPILLPLFGLEADWLGMHGVRALEEIEGLRNQWQPCVELMIQRDFLGAKLSQKQNDAVGRFRKAVISIANNTTTTHRRSRERGGILLL